MAINWKKVATGVAAASIGAAAFGAVHFMFLAPQYGVGDFMGIPLNVLLPFVVGTLGLVVSMGYIKEPGTMKDIVTYGSAATIGFGVAQYAGWISPVIPARARAPLRAPLRTMPARVTPVAGAKLI